MAVTKGMGANPLTRGQAGGRSLVAALGDSAGIMMVPVSRIAANPDNPPARVADVEALTESVREVGVLQPLLLVPVDVFTQAHPEHVAVLDGYDWVSLAGHRRHAAAVAAGRAEVPAVARRDLSEQGRDDEVLLHENLHRKELTPLEEARGYARMAARGLSQRAIAKHTGISQGQIAKRLSLLKLVPGVQVAVEQERLLVVDALEWVKAPERVQQVAAELLQEAAGTWQEDPARVLQSAQHQVTQEHRRAAAEARAAELGVAVHEPPVAGGQGQTRPVSTPAEIEAAAQRGDLFVEPGRYQDDPELVTTHRAEPEPVSDYEQREMATERDRKRATNAREECLRQIASAAPSTRQVSAALVQMTLAGGGLGGTVTTRARKLAAHAGIGPREDSDWGWRDQVSNVPSSRGHLAWLIYLAWSEDMAGSPFRTWGPEQVAYLGLLAERGGHVPTRWEQERLSEARSADQQEDGTR